MVRTRFAKEIQEEVVSRVLGQSFREVVQEKGLEPVGEPQLEHIDPFIDGAPMKFKARFEVKPHIELGEYRGLEIEDPKIEVTDTDVDAMIERLRDQASHLRVETDRGARGRRRGHDRDHLDAAKAASRRPTPARSRIGEETPLPELHEALQGKKPEDDGVVRPHVRRGSGAAKSGAARPCTST